MDESYKINLQASVQPFEEGHMCLLSRMLEEEEDSFVRLDFSRHNISHDDGHDDKRQTYFATQAKLNDSAMIEYGLKKSAMERKQSSD